VSQYVRIARGVAGNVSAAGQLADFTANFRLRLGALGDGQRKRAATLPKRQRRRRSPVRPTCAPSVLPEPIEAVGAQLGISHRVHDVAVAQEVLKRPGVDAVIGKLEAAGVAQHVRMNGKGKFGQFPSPADHFEEPGPGHRPAAFGIEDKTTLQVLPPQLPNGPDLLAGERVRAIDAVLGPPHMDTATFKLDHVPGQFAEFAGP
jgi:hypothetical protein